MTITIGHTTITVQRQPGDPRAKRSGYSGDGWSMEHHFMHMVKQALNELYGANLVKVNAAKDMHMLDDRLPILRPPRTDRKRKGEWNVCIYDGNYQLRNAARSYNAGETVYLSIIRPYYKEE